MNEQSLIRNLVRFAVERTPDLPITVRADIYEAAALVLEGPEADEAAATAVLLRRADAAQLKFASILK
jgi:hypothetical protein